MKVRFTEEMKGYHLPGAPAYDAGYVGGEAEIHRLMFHLTLSTDDVGAMLRDPLHEMRAEGYVRCKAFSQVPMPVEGGTFNLFSPGAARSRTLMRYRLPITTEEGEPMTFLGTKDVGDDLGTDAWPDTTTLFTRLVHGWVGFDAPADQEYSRGILHLNAVMFARQLSTMRGSPLAVGRVGAVFGAALPWVLPAVSREVLATGPDPARLRAAVDRIAAEVHAIRAPAASGTGS